MSTEVAERPAKPKKVLLRFPCKFNKANANLGDHVAALAFSVARENLNSTAAEECFCGHRINVRLVLGEGNPDQKTFWEGVQDNVQAVALVKAFRTSPKLIGSTLLFQMDGMKDTEILGRFAKKVGWLFVLSAESIEEAAEEVEAEEEEAEDDDTDTE